MKTKGVIGKRIVRVKQSMTSRGTDYRNSVNAIEYIELENGLRLIPHVAEATGEYLVDLVVNRTAMK